MNPAPSALTRFALKIGVCLLALTAWAPSSPAAQQEQVDVKLVLATDVSGSINNEELRIEREGTAEAFSDPEVIKAIQSGALGKIAVSMIDFSSPEYDKVVLDWHIVSDEASATAFAQAVRALPRTPGRRTSVSSALELGTLLIEGSDKDIVATRRVIDVSGDGPNNDGNSMTDAHEKTIAKGIVVNGLPVMDDMANGYFPNLDKYYQGCVAGGRGSFVIVVRAYRDFSQAMRRKLILEISSNENQIKQAMDAAAAKSLLMRTAAGDAPVLPGTPQILRSGPNEFSQNCDIAGGFGFGRFFR
jgi:hypothetical protein